MGQGPVRVALFGFGQVGRRAATILNRRAGVEIVGIISRSLTGRSARDLMPGLAPGLIISADAARTLTETRSDVVLHATAPRLSEVVDQLTLAIDARCRVISSCEELAYPWVVHRSIAEALDRHARSSSVAILGTGVNPGFVFDALVLDALSSRWSPSAILVSRVTDASFFGPAVRRRLGLGLSRKEFDARVAASEVAGHIGFRESMDLVAAALGIEVEEFEDSITPLMADRDGAGVTMGQTAGFTQRAIGICSGGLRLDFQLAVHLWPQTAGLEVVDRIVIRDEGSTYETHIRPASVALDTAAAQMVNTIPHILSAEPGLRTRLDMRGPIPWITFPARVGWRMSRLAAQ